MVKDTISSYPLEYLKMLAIPLALGPKESRSRLIYSMKAETRTMTFAE